MRTAYRLAVSVLLLAGSPLAGRGAQAPQNVSVTFNGETDAIDPLAAGEWHTLTANYRYPGKIGLLTNTFVVIARGGDLLRGLDVGYNLPANQLMIIKHGFWNATEATGQPGAKGRIIENDQACLDCENTVIKRTADEISVSYRLKFKPQVLKGLYSVYLYVEDKDVNHDGFTIISSVTIDRDAAVHRTDMPAQWVNSLQPQGAAAATLTLADKGQARYALVIPTDAKRIEKKAASDLRLYLKLISQADFALVSEADLAASGGPYLSVGRTQRLADSPCQWKDADLAAEGYAFEVVGENLYLYGGTGRGLLHGVYSLFEEDLGCRWYSTTSVDTPRTERLAVRLTPRKYLPVLELRDPYIHKLHDPNWSLRNKTNTPHARVPLAWGGSLRYHHMGHQPSSDLAGVPRLRPAAPPAEGGRLHHHPALHGRARLEVPVLLCGGIAGLPADAERLAGRQRQGLHLGLHHRLRALPGAHGQLAGGGREHAIPYSTRRQGNHV